MDHLISPPPVPPPRIAMHHKMSSVCHMSPTTTKYSKYLGKIQSFMMMSAHFFDIFILPFVARVSLCENFLVILSNYIVLTWFIFSSESYMVPIKIDFERVRLSLGATGAYFLQTVMNTVNGSCMVNFLHSIEVYK